MKRFLFLLLATTLLTGSYAYGETLHMRGGTYIGEVKYGKPHGQGTFTAFVGNKFVGQFKNGKFHGQGTLIGANRHRYVGEWAYNKKHGEGTYTWANGRKDVGEYKDNKLWEGLRYLASGKIWATVSGGKPCSGCKPTKEQLALVASISKGSSGSSSTASSSGSKVVWCATKYFYRKQKESTCKDQGGKSYRYPYQAKLEHKRLLQGISSSSSLWGEKVWCVHSGGVAVTPLSTCAAWEGKGYKEKSLALAEYNRRKGSSSHSTASTSSSTASSSSSTASSFSKVWCVIAGDYIQTQSGNQCIKLGGLRQESKREAQKATGKLSPMQEPSYYIAQIWCVTHKIAQTSNYLCSTKAGQAFSSKDLAEAEYKRQKSDIVYCYNAGLGLLEMQVTISLSQ